MVNLRRAIPGIVLDLRYAGTNNFMRQRLYPPLTTTYLRKAAADSCSPCRRELNKNGWGLKIFDAYRPYSVTERMWEPTYKTTGMRPIHEKAAATTAASPSTSRSSIFNKKKNSIWERGSIISAIPSPCFHQLSSAVPKPAAAEKIMEDHGFKALDTEWWHYYLPQQQAIRIARHPFARLKNEIVQHAYRNTDTQLSKETLNVLQTRSALQR